MILSSLTSIDILSMHALTCLLSQSGTGDAARAVVASSGGEVCHGWCDIVGVCCICVLHFHAVSVSCVCVCVCGARRRRCAARTADSRSVPPVKYSTGPKNTTSSKWNAMK